MELKLTARDKKLLVVLAYILIVTGLGYGVIYPLITKSQDLKIELQEKELVKLEMEQKVSKYPATLNRRNEMEGKLQEVSGQFYDVMPGTRIDKMLTEMAIAQNVTVNSFSISMPGTAEYTNLMNYVAMLEKSLPAYGMAQSIAPTDIITYNGMYAANVDLVLTGRKEDLQVILDQCAELEPKMRIEDFHWQIERKENLVRAVRNSEGEIVEAERMEITEVVRLTLSLQLYMGEDPVQYLESELAKLGVERALAENTEEESEDPEDLLDY